MRRRPWPIVILAFLQIVMEPICNVLFNAYWSAMSPADYIGWYARGHDWLSIFYVIGLPMVMGAAVYAMKQWSYPVFVAGALWMLMKDMQLVEAQLLPLWLSLVLLVANLVFVGYFLLPAVAAPYLNPKLRWWESKPRYRVEFTGRFEPEGAESLSCRFENLSVGGAFVDCRAPIQLRTPPMGSVGWLRMRVNKSAGSEQILSFKVKVAFSRGTGPSSLGFGLQFLSMSEETRAELRLLIRDLRRSGCRTSRSDSAWDDFRIWFWALVRSGRGLLPALDAGPMPAVPPQGIPSELRPEAKPAEQTERAAS